MPLYEYECAKCKKVIEMIQKFSDPALTACPTCGDPVTKLISRSSFELKGTGWYISDYKKGGGGNSPKSGGSSES